MRRLLVIAALALGSLGAVSVTTDTAGAAKPPPLLCSSINYGTFALAVPYGNLEGYLYCNGPHLYGAASPPNVCLQSSPFRGITAPWITVSCQPGPYDRRRSFVLIVPIPPTPTWYRLTFTWNGFNMNSAPRRFG